MTVAWDAVKAALVSHLAGARVVGVDHIFWEREAAPLAFDDVIELRIADERAVGHDDVEEVLLTTGDYAPRITGTREFTLSIRCHSRNQITAARNVLERARASFHHPMWVALLSERGVSFLSTEQIQTFDDVQDGRWESIAVLDVHFGVVSTFFDGVEALPLPGEPDTDGRLQHLVDVEVNGHLYPMPE